MDAGTGEVVIRGSRLLLRALRPTEIDGQRQAMVNSDPIAIVRIPDEAGFKARLRRCLRLPHPLA
jgi:hypothetical protein